MGRIPNLGLSSLNDIFGFTFVHVDEKEETEKSMTAAGDSTLAGKSAAGLPLATAAVVAACPTTVASGILVKPHQKGHSAGTLPRFAIEQFRGILERAGFGQVTLSFLNGVTIATPKNQTPTPNV
jgi:hypothetical protein